MGGLVPAYWWVELGLVPLVGKAISEGVFIIGQLFIQDDFKQTVCRWMGLCSHPVGCLA